MTSRSRFSLCKGLNCNPSVLYKKTINDQADGLNERIYGATRLSERIPIIRIITINYRVHSTTTLVKVSSATFSSLSGSKCTTSCAFAA